MQYINEVLLLCPVISAMRQRSDVKVFEPSDQDVNKHTVNDRRIM